MMTGFLKFTFGMLLVFSCVFVGAADLKRLETSIPRTDKPPVIDGDLSDVCWGKAVVLPDFYVFQGGGRTTDAVKTRVIHDGEWLYLGFEIGIPHPELIKDLVLEPDGNISAYDSVEMFFDPGTGGKTYLHYMLSAGNVRGERRVTNMSIERMWNVPWRSATVIDDDGWRAEIGIPLSVLAEHGKLEGLTMNVGVNRILTVLNEFGAPVSASRETSSWAPAPRGFHDPSIFGLTKGLDKVEPPVPMLVAFQGVRTSPYKVSGDGGFYYNVSGSVLGYTDRAGRIIVAVQDLPGEEHGETAQQELEVAGAGNIIDFSVDMPVKILSDRTAELTLRDPITGEAFQSMPLLDMAGLSLMRSFVRYSYYTTEKEAQVVCELGLPEQELSGMRLVVKDESGRTLAEEKKLSPKTFVKVPVRRFMRKIPDGKHVWTVELQRADGAVAVAQEVTMIKRAPLPGCEWKIDHGKGRLLNNGEPFFPFGIMAKIYTKNEETAERMCVDFKEMGFNSIIRWSKEPPAQIGRLFELAEKHDFYVIDFPSYWRFEPVEGETSPRREEGMDDLAASAMHWDWIMENRIGPELEKHMRHPRLMAHYLWDEPGQSLVAHAAIERMNEWIYNIDGYHPTQVLYIPPVPAGDLFSRNCDILGVDPYWVPGGGVGDIGSPNIVGRQTWLARRRADRDLKLAWITPCAEWWSGTRMRIFNENEQRVQTYLALIHGAQAILYFDYPLKHHVSYKALAGLGREMKVLGPAMTAGEVSQVIEASPVGFDPANNIFPDVQASLRRNPDGGYILLAANWKAYPADVTWTVSILGESGSVKRMFTDEQDLDVKNSTFADRFGPMDTRAYAIPGPADLSGPVRIKIDVTAIPEQIDRFYTRVGIPDSGAPGRKNLLRNSGFEDDSIPGIPDYYYNVRGSTGRWRVGDPRGEASYGVCTENPFEGKQSMRFKVSGSMFPIFPVNPVVSEPTPFVFSAWARSDNTNAMIQFYGPVESDPRRFKLGTEWQRISGAGMAESEVYGFFILGLQDTEHNVWIDAMQFELGEELTDYEP